MGGFCRDFDPWKIYKDKPQFLLSVELSWIYTFGHVGSASKVGSVINVPLGWNGCDVI